MPTPPYAQLRVSINAGPPVTGGITILNGDSIEVSYTSTVDWSTHVLEIFDYPDGWVGPGAPWTTVIVPQPDGTNATVFRYTGGTAPPPAFTAPALPLWGKIMFQLVVNGGIKAGAVSAELTDDATALKILSPNGMPGIAWREGRQFGGHRKWVGDIQGTLTALDSSIGSILVNPWKDSVVATTTANVALTGAPASVDTDDVTVGDGERLLVGMAQTAGEERGIYVVSTSGAWTRAADADSEIELLGLTVLVRGGTVNEGRIYQCATNSPITVDTTSLTFARIPDRQNDTAATPDTYVLRDDVGDGFFNSVELASSGELRADVGGTKVMIATVDGSKNMQIGDGVDTESISVVAGTNKNIALSGTGTAVLSLAALGAASEVAITSNGAPILSAKNGRFGAFGATQVPQQAVTGSRVAGNFTAAKGTLNAHIAYGWLTDSTSAAQRAVVTADTVGTRTATTSDYHILFDTTTGSGELFLYAAAGANQDSQLIIDNTGTNTLQITPNGGDTVNGFSPLVILPGSSLWIVSTGTGWRIFAFWIIPSMNADADTVVLRSSTGAIVAAGATLSGLTIFSGDNAGQQYRYGTIVDAPSTTVDVAKDYYRLATPTANNDIFIRTATAIVPTTGQRIVFTRPATGAFTWTIYNEGSGDAIVTLTASNHCSAHVVFNGSAWELAEFSPNATPGPAA